MSRGIVDIDLPYSVAIADAEGRMKRGERQLYCGVCQRWVWPDQCQHPGRWSQAGFRRETKRLEREMRQGDADGQARGERP